MTTKVLLVLDRRGWAYETKAIAIASKYQGDKLKFSIIGGKEDPEKVRSAFQSNDLYVFFGFQNFRNCHRRYGIDYQKSLVSIASHESWDNLETTPTNQVLPGKKITTYLSQFKSVSAVSYRLQLLFKKAGMPHVVYTPNGVPIEAFPPNYSEAYSEVLVCGYAGRDKDQKKGNRSIIEPAVKRVKGTTLKQALCDFKMERKTGTRGIKYLDYTEMPIFYRGIDVYLCASREEGSCRSVLEAMSSGCAIISTDCGAINELLIHGYNGLLVDRNPEAFIQAIHTLNKRRDLLMKMKRRSREIVEQYSWDRVVQYWYQWIESAI